MASRASASVTGSAYDEQGQAPYPPRRLLVVRHGRTAWNADGRFQGHTDIPLDDEGRARARALGESLRAEPIDRVACSDLGRARETAELLTAGRDLALASDPEWREMRFGEWEGLTWAEITARHPHLDEAAHTQPRFYTPAGGETFDELCVRIAAAAERAIVGTSPGGTTLVVTHAGPLHALVRVLRSVPEEEALRMRFLPLSLVRFVEAEGGWRMSL